MFTSRKLNAGAVAVFAMSAASFALVEAHAELIDANTVPVPRAEAPAILPQPIAEAPRAPAQPAAPAAAETPEPAAPAAPRRTSVASSDAVDSELICLAKVVFHESANQSRAGQLAVAQVVMNRVRSPRFPNTICGVVMQRGQFFNVHAFNPPRDARWRRALEVARDARAGISPPVVGNATFFHATYARPFRGRVRVARLGDHIFYR